MKLLPEADRAVNGFPRRPGISDDFLTRASVTILPDPERLHIPYHDIDGAPTGHFRDRFKTAVTGADGKPQRYSQPFESGMHAYLPPFPLVKGEDLFITEGEFKALALTEAGFNAVGLPGLFCYCDGEILPGLRQAVDLVAPPTIFLIGDADTLFNLDYYRSAKFLADQFNEIPVCLLQPPLDGPKGVDDVKEETGRRFVRWLDDEIQDATLVVEGQNFLQTAAIRLTEKAKSVQPIHLEKLIKMATEASKSSEPLWAVSHLREVIQKCSRLRQADFDRSVKERLTEGVEQSIGAEHTDELLAYYDYIKNNPWSEPVELSDILQELYDLTKVYIATEDDTRILATLWAGITYTKSTCPYLPMLIFTAPEEESGKTNYQTVVGLCCYRPRILVGLSPNSFHRAVEESKGTFLIDEARAGADDGLLRSFLNAGFNNTGNPVLSPTVPRYNTDAGRMEHFRTTYFKTFAGIGTFLERDTLSRSIIIRMKPYLLAEEKNVKDIAFLTDEETISIARKFTTYWTDERVADFQSQCKAMLPEMPEQLRGRHKQKFCPLYALAKLAGKDWYQRIEAASLATLKRPNPAQLNLSQQCMRDVATVVMRELENKENGEPTLLLTTIKGDRDFISTDTLIAAMKKLHEAPWKSYGPSKRMLLPNDLYFLLKPYEELKRERPRFGPTKIWGMFTDNIMDIYHRHCRANEVVNVSEIDEDLEVIEPGSGTPESPGQGAGHRPGHPEMQEAEMEKDDLLTAWKLEQRLAPIVVGMTNRGIGFNLDGVTEAKADLENRLADATARALAWFDTPGLNLNSHVQLLAAFQSKGRHLSSTSEDALKADGSEGAALLLEYRNIRDKELKFLTGLSEATRSDGRIHAIFNSVGTKTGRFSCKDPNLQNIPKLGKGLFPIRSLFQAPPGRKLVIADFAQMELVAASVLAPEPKMLAAFKNGEDLHCRTASILLGRTVTKDDKANRSLAKAVNFGLLYGQSAAGLKTYAKNSYGVTMTDEEAVQFRAAFFQEYQGLATWHETARATANDPDVTEVRTHRIGRRQHLADSEHWWPRFASLVNTPIQGSCAEVQKLGMLDIGEKLKGRAQLVSCVHDEVIVECDEADAMAVMAEVQAFMGARSAEIFNGQAIGVEAHIADNWAGSVRVPTTYSDTRSTENATQTELVLSA